MLVDRDRNGDRRIPFATTTICLPGFNSRRHIELRRDDRSAHRDAHRAVAMRLAVGRMSGSVVRDAHQRIVGRVLEIVSVSIGLRQTVELGTGVNYS